MHDEEDLIQKGLSSIGLEQNILDAQKVIDNHVTCTKDNLTKKDLNEIKNSKEYYKYIKEKIAYFISFCK